MKQTTPSSRPWRSIVCAALLVAAWPAGAATDAERELTALERIGRARPAEASAAMRRLVPGLAPRSADHLELLTALGLELAAARHPEEARAVAAELGAWPGVAPAAAVLLIGAGVQTQGGSLRTADAMLTDAMAHVPAGTPARSRLRFVAMQAYVKKESGQLEAAMRLYQEALALADEIGAPEWQVDMRCGLARVALQAGQAERARLLNHEALAIAERSGDDYSIYRVHGTEGLLRDAADDRDGMRREFELALEHARRAGAGAAESLMLSKLSDYSLKAGDYKTALAMAQKALPLTRQLGDTEGETVALFNAGVALIAMHHLEPGKRYVHESIAINERRAARSGLSASYREFGSYLEKAGDAAGAIAAFHRYRAIDDDIVQRDQQRALVELQQRFDAERRDRDLAVLNRENAIKSEQLRRQSLQQELWWLLAASCVLALAALLALYGRIRRTNRLLAARNAELARQGERDPLTGLANRRHVQALVEALPAGEPFSASLLLIDLDRFKTINDRHGHAAGDAVLIETARRLRELVGRRGLVARWGGEEFLVAMAGLTGDAALALAERCLAVLASRPVGTETRAVDVTASIGVATFPMPGARCEISPERALRLADGALYLAKEQGRNRACGVLRLDAHDAAAFDAAASALAAASRAGRAQLSVLVGPAERLAA